MDNYNELTKPRINMLPMKEIKEEILRSFRQENKIELEKMAVIYDGNNEIIGDRDTVKNTKLLDGKSSSNYMLKSQMQQYNSNATNELLDLKAELYELKNELIKNDAISYSNVYNGYQDCMKKNFISYEKSNISNKEIIEQHNDNKSYTFNRLVDSIDDRLGVGDYLSLHLKNKTNIIDKIDDIDGKRLMLHNEDSTKRNVKYFSQNSGEYNNGFYSFSKTDIDSGSGDTKVFGFNDGRNKTKFKLSDNDIGLLHTFYVDKPLTNIKEGIDSTPMWIMKNITINAIPQSDEGYLICYVIKADDYDKITEVNKHNLLQLKSNEEIEIIAKSAPVYSASFEAGVEDQVNFDFTNEDVEIEPNNVYGLLVLYHNNGSRNIYSNYWDIIVSHYKNQKEDIGDEHRSNELYLCSSQDNETIMVEKVFDKDLQYQISLEEKIHVEFMPHISGLYTAYFNHNQESSKAILSMQIKKEGINYFQHDGISFYPKGSRIPIKTDYNYTTSPICKGDTIVLGNNKRKVLDITNTDGVYNAILTDDIYIDKPINDNRVPAYRMNYKVLLTGYHKDKSDNILNRVGTTEMHFSKIIPDIYDNIDRNYSDRLIFETSNNSKNLLLKSDYFKLQIVWDSVTDDNAMLANNRSLVGGIKNINLAFDNNISIL